MFVPCTALLYESTVVTRTVKLSTTMLSISCAIRLIPFLMMSSLFSIKAFVNFEILIRFHRQAFIKYKNGENLKILREVFRQKLTVSNVILVFLNHLKPKIFCVVQSWWQTPPFFKIFGSAPILMNRYIPGIKLDFRTTLLKPLKQKVTRTSYVMEKLLTAKILLLFNSMNM